MGSGSALPPSSLPGSPTAMNVSSKWVGEPDYPPPCQALRAQLELSPGGLDIQNTLLNLGPAWDVYHCAIDMSLEECLKLCDLIDFIEVNFSYYGILQALSSYLVFVPQ